MGVVLLYLGWAGIVGGTLGALFRILGFLPLLTGVFGYCAIYSIFGVSDVPGAISYRLTGAGAPAAARSRTFSPGRDPSTRETLRARAARAVPASKSASRSEGPSMLRRRVVAKIQPPAPG